MNYKKLYKELYSKIDLEKVLQEYKILYNARSGSEGEEFSSCCPLPGHDDLNPSFSIRKDNGLFNCFVCGGGDFFSFIKKMERLETTFAAIQHVKNKLGIVDEQKKDFFDNITKPYCEDEETVRDTKEPDFTEIPLPSGCVPAFKYYDIVKSRVSVSTIDRWNMLYCPDDEKYKGRLIMPIVFKGIRVSFGARDMLGRADKWDKIKKEAVAEGKSRDEIANLEKKYGCKKILYPYGTPIAHMFFNWDNAIKNKNEVILCEGILDCVRIVNYGYNAIAIFSCNMNTYKTELLIKNFKRIFIALDNDDKIKSDGTQSNPGQAAAQKILTKSLKDVEAYNILLPPGKDPDKCSEQEFRDSYNKSQRVFKDLAF